ncbi:MAG: PLP-dependent aminotransferase family protein, partial [Armatimonadota bacterium]
NIVVTLGSQQGFLMLGRYLMQPGDKVAIEGADHLGGDRRWAALGLNRHVVPRLDEEEPDLNELAKVGAKVLVVSPTGCGTSGRVMAPATRLRMISMAKETGMTIVEDASNSAIVYGERPRDLIALGDGIIQVGSFANSLAPGVRLGYIAAEANICRDLAAIQQIETGGLGLPMQIAMASYMRKGLFQEHIKRCVPRYRKRRDALMSAMAKHFPKGVTWSMPMAGFGCKVDLGRDIDQRTMYDRAVDAGVAFTPGAMIFGETEQFRCIRVCFGNQTESRIEEGIRILGELLSGS